MDIETLATTAGAVVLSIGLCFFDDEKEQDFDEIVSNGVELFFDRDEQRNRFIDPKTIEWWGKQGEAARRCLEPAEVIKPRDMHTHLEACCSKLDLNYNWVKKYCRWFTRGPHFDIAIMDSLLNDHNVSSPWKYYLVRDIRTWLECNGLPDNLKLEKPDSMIAHNALHDAAFDAWMLQQVSFRPTEQLNIHQKERAA
jgi:hypothetical protein